MANIFQGRDLSCVRVPLGGDKVYKEECMYCFDSPESEGGLYVSLTSFLGLSRGYLELHYQKTKEWLYLHIKKTRKPPSSPPPETVEAPPTKKPTRLAIGVEGGFDGGEEKIEYEESLSVVVLPEFSSLPVAQAPKIVQDSVAGVLSASTASKQEAIAAWDGEKRVVSKYAENLVQLNNGVKVPPSGWKCSKCELTNNLWMNLTDGTILCGRKYFDGSGGNNHAVDYYESTRYPLAVKLGTITPDGADVYSYDEDDMVLDPLLNQHLAHFGIDISSMTKTDVTMTELEIDMNMRIGEWSIIQESGKQLVPCFGPGCTGLRNLGNSCYLNSVMQVMFSLPEFKQRYFDNADVTFQSSPANPTSDLDTQLSKLAVGLLSGRYSVGPPKQDKQDDSKPTKDQQGISPMMFKALIGRNHPEFSTMRQQDAQEFFLHLLATVDKGQRSKPGSANIVDLFRYRTEERVECVVSGKVRYTLREDNLLALPVPMDSATNKMEVEAWEAKKKELEAAKKRISPDDIVRAKVPFSVCLEKFGLPQEIPDFYSTAVGGKSLAKKTTRFATFPDYLMIQMVKFTFADDWVPKKMDVLIDVPDVLDLTELRGTGLQQGESQLPEGDAPANQQEEKPVEINEEIVMQLVSMGFDLQGCTKAVFNTKNQGVEPAMNWVLEHMGDPDFTAPFEPPQSKGRPSEGGFSPNEDGIAMVMSLGFSREQAIKALKATDNSVERAADWVFSHMDELDTPMEQDQPSEEQASKYRDGPGKYELVAFISHMGTSTMCGHYVCHIKKDGKWIIYNDTKVAESEAPPRQLAYLYLYKRNSTN